MFTITFAGGAAGAEGAELEDEAGLLVLEPAVVALELELDPEALLPAFGSLLPEPAVAEALEIVPPFAFVVLLEKDFEEPPHPTMELTAIAATPNFIKIVGSNCTKNLKPIFATN